jgi:hypothetical protein
MDSPLVVTGPLSSPETRLLLSRSDLGLFITDRETESLDSFDLAAVRGFRTPIVGYVVAATPAGAGRKRLSKPSSWNGTTGSWSPAPDGKREFVTSQGRR